MDAAPPIREDDVVERHNVEEPLCAAVDETTVDLPPSTVCATKDHPAEVENPSLTDSPTTMNHRSNDGSNVLHNNRGMNLFLRANKTVLDKGVQAKTMGARAGAKLGSRLAKGLEKLSAAKKQPSENDVGGTGTTNEAKTGVGGINPMKTVQGFVRSIGKPQNDLEGDIDGGNSGSLGGNNPTNCHDSGTITKRGRKQKVVGATNSARTFPDECLDPDGPFPPLSQGRLDEMTSVLLTDSVVFWVTAFSIAASATCDYWDRIFMENSFPLSVVLAWSLFAFAIGVDIDAYTFFDGIKRFVVDFRVENKEATEMLESRLEFSKKENSIPREASKMGFFRRIFGGHATTPTDREKRGNLPGIKAITTLRSKHNRSNGSQKENRALENFDFLTRIARFGHIISFDKHHHKHREEGGVSSFDSVGATSTQSTPDTTPVGGQGTSQHSTKSDISMGTTVIEDWKSTSQKLVRPQCELRGLDLFRTDTAENEMLTHPFLIEYAAFV
jgi:hypothetical protein